MKKCVHDIVGGSGYLYINERGEKQPGKCFYVDSKKRLGYNILCNKFVTNKKQKQQICHGIIQRKREPLKKNLERQIKNAGYSAFYQEGMRK